LNAKKSAF